MKGLSHVSLRKAAALLGTLAVAVSLIGAGVSATFTDQVTAQEDINVGTFECRITEPVTPGAIIAGDAKSVTYTAPTIMSSDPGSAPFMFTVANTGSIPAVLTVTTSSVSAPFSVIGYPFAPIALAYPGTYTYNTGVQWTELSNDNLGQSGSVTWTVHCTDTETQNVDSDGLQYGPTGWGGWSCPVGKEIVSASYTGGDLASLILWRPGATAGSYTYPTTPFGYTYAAGEQGVIGQNDNDSGETIVLHLVCTA
jgi:predicted ribosomally synthesized peptide with SipW-like signal peptide